MLIYPVQWKCIFVKVTLYVSVCNNFANIICSSVSQRLKWRIKKIPPPPHPLLVGWQRKRTIQNSYSQRPCCGLFLSYFSHRVRFDWPAPTSCFSVKYIFLKQKREIRNSLCLGFKLGLFTAPSGVSPLKRVSDKSMWSEKVMGVQVRHASINREGEAKGGSYAGTMGNNLLEWHCCLTHKTLQCIYDDLTGWLGCSVWVCIWERGGIRPLTQSNKCYCIYSLADSLMFFSQRLEASIFFLVEAEEWGGRRSPPLAVTRRSCKSRQRKRPFRGSEGSGLIHHILSFFFFLNVFKKQAGGWTDMETDGQTASVRHHKHLHTPTNDIWIVYCQTVQTVLIRKEL